MRRPTGFCWGKALSASRLVDDDNVVGGRTRAEVFAIDHAYAEGVEELRRHGVDIGTHRGGLFIADPGTKEFCVPSRLSGTLLPRLTDSTPGMARAFSRMASTTRRVSPGA